MKYEVESGEKKCQLYIPLGVSIALLPHPHQTRHPSPSMHSFHTVHAHRGCVAIAILKVLAVLSALVQSVRKLHVGLHHVVAALDKFQSLHNVVFVAAAVVAAVAVAVVVAVAVAAVGFGPE